jgi:hypothetical protein
MKTLSILLASAIIMIGLAVSSNAIADPTAHEIVSEGKILMKRESGFWEFIFLVEHDGLIFWCESSQGILDCKKLEGSVE